MLTKKSQAGRYAKKPKYKKPPVPEENIQAFADDLFKIKRIKYIRIPDNVFRWLSINAPWLMKSLAGIADNVGMIPINDKYSLCLNLEIKTKTGQLHGRQKINAKELSWQIARSVEEVQKIIEDFEKAAEKLKEKI